MSKDERNSGTPTSTPVPSTPKVTLKPSTTGSHRNVKGESGSRSGTPMPGAPPRWRRGRKWVKRLVNVPTIDGTFQTFMWVAEEAGAVPPASSLHNPENAISADFRPRPGVNPVTQRPVYQIMQQTPSRGIPPSPSPTPQSQSKGGQTKTVAGASEGGGGAGAEGGAKSGFKIIIRKGSLSGNVKGEIGETGSNSIMEEVKETESGGEEEVREENSANGEEPQGRGGGGGENENSKGGLIGEGREATSMEDGIENDMIGGVMEESGRNLSENLGNNLMECGDVGTEMAGEGLEGEGEQGHGGVDEGEEGGQMNLDSESEVDVL